MFTLLIRAIVVYILVLLVFRLMGKRQLGQMQPFELVLALIIADLATIPMAESSVPVLHGIIPLLTLVTMHYILTIITRKSETLNKVISGKPVIVINPNGIDYTELKNLNFSLDDLFEAIRSCNYFSIDEVEYAIVETNGKVNVLPKKEYTPLTVSNSVQILKDNINGIEEPTIPVTIISEGQKMKNNMKVASVEDDFITSVLTFTKTKHIKNVLVLTVDSNGKIYFQSKNGKGCVFQRSQLGAAQ